MNVFGALALSLLMASTFLLIGTAYLRRHSVFPECGAPVASLLCFSAAGVLAITENATTLALAVIVPVVIVSTYTDLRYGLILDIVTFPALALLLGSAGPHLPGALIGGALGAGVIGLILLLTAGRGMGFGDLKLAACIGAAFGLLGGAYAIGLAFIFGAAHGTLLMATKKAGCKTPLRFAPYLAAGVLVVVLGKLGS